MLLSPNRLQVKTPAQGAIWADLRDGGTVTVLRSAPAVGSLFHPASGRYQVVSGLEAPVSTPQAMLGAQGNGSMEGPRRGRPASLHPIQVAVVLLCARGSLAAAP